MKPITVVTYCTWTSLGSMLQAYGLKKALSDIGYESTILLPDGSNEYRLTQIHSMKSLAIYLFDLCIHSKKKSAYDKRLAFIDTYLDITPYKTYRSLAAGIGTADDIFLSGSDQIWNPDRCDPAFFLDFVKEGKCISYAASMGNTQISDKTQTAIAQMLKKYSKISVREKACALALQGLVDQPISINIDPTFLVSVEEWKSLETKYPLSSPYILLYMLYWDDSYKQQIQELKRKTGLKVVAIANHLSRVWADQYLFDVGPGDFLWLFDHAAYVVTSSFHGTAFSVLFQKNFSVIVNPKLPSRIENLMELLNIPYVEIDQLPETQKFQYDKIEIRIAEEKKNGLDYLKGALR